MAHRYRVIVLPLDEDREGPADPLEFETTNHDDLFTVLGKMRAKAIVPASEAAALTIGLKLFTEVLLQHRAAPPFDALWPHMAAFMKALKAAPAPAQQG